MDILRCQPSVSNNIQNGISLRRHRGKRSCCCSQCAVSSWLQTKGKLVQALCVRLLLLFLSDWHWSQCHFQVVLRFWLRNLFRQKVWKMTFDHFWLMIMSILASSACTALKQHGLKEGGLCQIFRADLIPSWDFTLLELLIHDFDFLWIWLQKSHCPLIDFPEVFLKSHSFLALNKGKTN